MEGEEDNHIDELPSDEESLSDSSNASDDDESSGSDNGNDSGDSKNDKNLKNNNKNTKPSSSSDDDDDEDEDETPRLGAKHNKKKSLRKPRAPKPSTATSSKRKSSKSKKTGKRRYVDDAAEESDGEGGVQNGDDENEEEDDDEDSGEFDGFIAKDEDITSDSGISSTDSDSDDDNSDDSDASGTKRRKPTKLRRIASKESDEADEDDLALVAEAEGEGLVQLDETVRQKIQTKLRTKKSTSEENMDDDGEEIHRIRPTMDNNGLVTSTTRFDADTNDIEKEEENIPIAPSALDKDYESDDMDDFIVDDTGEYAREKAMYGGRNRTTDDNDKDTEPLSTQRSRITAAKKRKRLDGVPGGGVGATDEQVALYNDIFGTSGGVSGENADFSALFGDNELYSKPVEIGVDEDEDDEDYDEADEFLQPHERLAKLKAQKAKTKEGKVTTATTTGDGNVVSGVPTVTSTTVNKKAIAIRTTFEPGVLEQHFFTSEDTLIRNKDEPERLQIALKLRRLRRKNITDRITEALTNYPNGAVSKLWHDIVTKHSSPVVPAVSAAPSTEEDNTTTGTTLSSSTASMDIAAVPVTPFNSFVMYESTWITDHLLTNPAEIFSNPYSDILPSFALITPPNSSPDYISKEKSQILTAVQYILKAVMEDKYELPYLWLYHRDQLHHSFSLAHLWSIFDLDEIWTRMYERKIFVAAAIDKAIRDQEMNENQSIYLRDLLLSTHSVRGIEDIATLVDQIRSVGKFIKANNANAYMDETNGTTLSSGTMSQSNNGRSDLYRLAYATDVRLIIPQIFLTADNLASNVRAEDRITEPPSPGGNDQQSAQFLSDLAFQALGTEFQHETDVLRAARHVAAMDIAREPYLRQLLRRSYYNRVMISTSHTDKGRANLDPAHSFFGLHVLQRKLLRDFVDCRPHRVRLNEQNNPFTFAYQSLIDDELPSVGYETNTEAYEGTNFLDTHGGYGSNLVHDRIDIVHSMNGTSVPFARNTQQPFNTASDVKIRHEARVGGPTQYTVLQKAEQEGFITITVDTDPDWLNEQLSLLCQYYLSVNGLGQISTVKNVMDATLSSELDKQRRLVVQLAIEKVLVPEFRNEVRDHLRNLASSAVAAEYANTLRKFVLMAPPTVPPQPLRRRKGEDNSNTNETVGNAALSAAPKLPWQRSRHRVMVVALARRGDDSSDIATLIDPRGDMVEFVVIPNDKDQRIVVLSEFMFNQAPDMVVIPATGGLQRCRDMKRAVVSAGIAYEALVMKARMNYKRRKELVREHGPTVEHSKEPRVHAEWEATKMFGALETTAMKWNTHDEWKLLKPRCPVLVPRTDRFGNPRLDRDGNTILDPDDSKSTLPILYVPDELARVYAASSRSKTEFNDYTPIVRYSVCLGRFVQDPLMEIAYLWGSKGDTAGLLAEADKAGVTSLSSDILATRFHPLQNDIPNSLILQAAERIMVEGAAGTGIDINAIHSRSHLSALIQFIPGLGPRKAEVLLGQLSTRRLKSRNELLTRRLLTSTVYTNAVGFLRVNPVNTFLGPKSLMQRPAKDTTVNVGRKGRNNTGNDYGEVAIDEQELDYDILDSTRIHPNHYWLARTFAKEVEASMYQAMKQDPGASSSDGTSIVVPANTRWNKYVEFLTKEMLLPQELRTALRRISLYCQKKLNEMLEQKAINFERWTPQKKHPGHVTVTVEPEDGLQDLDLHSFAITLYQSYSQQLHTVMELIKMELRAPYRETRKSWETITPAGLFRLFTGETSISFRKGAIVTAEIADVMDNRLIIRMENGLRGNIYADVLDVPKDPSGRLNRGDSLRNHFKPRQVLNVKILRVDIARFSFDASGSKADTRTANFPVMDSFANIRAAEDIQDELNQELTRAAAKAALEVGASSNLLAQQSMGKGLQLRAIGHPAFKNITRTDAEQYLADKPLYECVIRPSSLGLEHLTITWKLAEPNFFAHIDVLEQEKDVINPAGLGRRLIIDKDSTHNKNGYVYSDIDELLTRHIEPMVMHHRSLRASRIYRDAPPSVVDDLLRLELLEKPGRIPYIIAPDTTNIGYYRIAYILRAKPHSEPIKVVPGGYLYKGVISTDWRKLIDDFKNRVRVDPKAEAAAKAAAMAKAAAQQKQTGTPAWASQASSTQQQQQQRPSSSGGVSSSSSTTAAANRATRWGNAPVPTTQSGYGQGGNNGPTYTGAASNEPSWLQNPSSSSSNSYPSQYLSAQPYQPPSQGGSGWGAPPMATYSTGGSGTTGTSGGWGQATTTTMGYPTPQPPHMYPPSSTNYGSTAYPSSSSSSYSSSSSAYPRGYPSNR